MMVIYWLVVWNIFLFFYSVGKIIERNGEIVHQQAMAKMRPEDMRGIFIWLVVWNHGIL